MCAGGSLRWHAITAPLLFECVVAIQFDLPGPLGWHFALVLANGRFLPLWSASNVFFALSRVG